MEKARDYKKKHSLTPTIIASISSMKRKHKIGLPGKMINGTFVKESNFKQIMLKPLKKTNSLTF